MKVIKILVTLLSLISFNAFAGFVGPESADFTKVKDVLDKGRNEMYVVLTGHITKRISNDRYLFRDDSGEIIVEIKNHVFAEITVTPETKITLRGEIDIEKNQVEIEVKSLTVEK